MPINWEEIDSSESLREALKNLESRIKNLENATTGTVLNKSLVNAPQIEVKPRYGRKRK